MKLLKKSAPYLITAAVVVVVLSTTDVGAKISSKVRSTFKGSAA